MLLILAAALSLGFESEAEIIELQLKEEIPHEQVKAQMQAILPEGIEILSCYAPQHKMGQMGFAEYQVTLPCEDSTALKAMWEEFLSQPQILVEKKTKRGMREIDLKEQTECLSAADGEGALTLLLRLPAGNAVNVNPSLLIETFGKMEGTAFGFPGYRRLRLLTAEKSEFF